LDNPARSIYQLGRALMVSGQFAAAKRRFEEAIAGGYQAANIELAMLLSQPSAAVLDVPKAISLYEHAWKVGVNMAAFELGNLYEHGLHTAGNEAQYALAPDQSRSWSWYRKGADAGEPNALARFAEKADAAAFALDNVRQKNQLLLDEFRYYAVAEERARREDWPDDAWRNWRYRRASLARMLARNGMMEQVTSVYDAVRQSAVESSERIRRQKLADHQ
jgi:TPR repeat protein